MVELIIETKDTYHIKQYESTDVLKRNHTRNLLKMIRKHIPSTNVHCEGNKYKLSYNLRTYTVEFFHRLEETDNSNYTKLRTTAVISTTK